MSASRAFVLTVVLLSASYAVAQPGSGPGTGPLPCGLQSGWPYFPYLNNQPYTNTTVQTFYKYVDVRPFAGGPIQGNAASIRLTLVGDSIELKINFQKGRTGAPLISAKPSTAATYLAFNFFSDGTQNWENSGTSAKCSVAQSNLQFYVRWGQTTTSTLAAPYSITFADDNQTVYVRQRFRNTNLGFWYYNQGQLCQDGLGQGGPYNTWELGLRVYNQADQQPTVVCGQDNINATSLLFRLSCGTPANCAP